MNPDLDLGVPLLRKSWIDSVYTNETTTPKVRTLHFSIDDVLMWRQIRNGVKMGEGDGTVSLLSLGAMCVEGWKRPKWNPAGIKIKTIEVNGYKMQYSPTLTTADSSLTAPSPPFLAAVQIPAIMLTY